MGLQGTVVRRDGAPVAESTTLSHATPLPRTDRMPVLLALPMKFSAKQVYLPSSDRLMFLMIKVPSGVTVTLQPGQSRCGHPGDTHGPGKGLGSREKAGEQERLGVGCGRYLLLLTKISVPLLQSTTAFGAARGWQGIMTSPPRAAGIRRRTGFSLKSGASAGRKGEHPTVTRCVC